MTGHTTAKITSQHRLIYDKLIKNFGLERAAQYAEANQAAIGAYAEIVQEKTIDCNFEYKNAYVYTMRNADAIESEVNAARRLGIPADYVQQTNLPFQVKAAERFENQAQFHPLKFVSGILDGLTIYEDTKALTVEGHTVHTGHGRITAQNIIIATHYPFIIVPGYYPLRMHQERSYVIAVRGAPPVEGMYVDENMSGYSFRSYEDLLLLGGGGHRSGKNPDGGKYRQLAECARELYGRNINIPYGWSAQDCMPHDGVPFIGRFSSKTPYMYVATGFNKWGMTTSMVSSMILTDMILKNDNPWKDVFSPQRFKLAAAGPLLSDGAQMVVNLSAQLLHTPLNSTDSVVKGQGKIVRYKGAKHGVYKDEMGHIYAVKTKCPHMGCELKWNPDELSWDCPCHGSRFDIEGHLLNEPAQEDLKH
jgi:FAD dependent oxidoreductase./Rieske [2Fe-2S] domain.